MEKQLMTRINLYIDYNGQNKPITETHKTFEVSKETSDRIYFKGNQYVSKNNVHNVVGKTECVMINGTLTVKSNLTVYCKQEDVKSFQMIIRDEFLKQSKLLQETTSNFHRYFGHDEIIEPNSHYVEVSKDSEVIV